MSYMMAIVGFAYEVLSFFWLLLLGPRVNSADRDSAAARRRRLAAIESESVAALRGLPASGGRLEQRGVVVDTFSGNGKGKVEVDVSDSFLSQLEQRTQQVKITLANLEAEKTRIEAQIAQLQPVIPHYDALLAAERALDEANVAIEASHPAPQPAPGWNNEPSQPANNW